MNAGLRFNIKGFFMIRSYNVYRSPILVVLIFPAAILPNDNELINENIHIQRNGYNTGNFVGGFAAQVISMTDAVMSSGLTIIPFATAGVVHNNASGLFSSSLIVNADIAAAAAIVDTKLATISTAGKVSNSATTATNTNTASAIVARDASGNFTTNMITLNDTTTNSTDVATKAYVDSTVGGTNVNTANTVVRRDNTGSFAAQLFSIIDSVQSGNIILSTNPSTSTAGNIMKGANRFIHNFGTNNTFVGENAGNFSMSGTGQNVAIGTNALNANTTGNNNIAIGNGAGNNVTTGSGNILINATAGTATESNAIRIGTSQSTCFIQGINGSTLISAATVVVNGSGQLGVLLSSEKYKHDIEDMGELSSRIYVLRPVTFVYNSDENNLSQYGLIAEEVEKVFPELIVYDKNGLPQTVQYHVLPVLLLNEIKKQHRAIEELKKNNIQYDIIIQDLLKRMRSLERRI